MPPAPSGSRTSYGPSRTPGCRDRDALRDADARSGGTGVAPLRMRQAGLNQRQVNSTLRFKRTADAEESWIAPRFTAPVPAASTPQTSPERGQGDGQRGQQELP